MTLEEAQTQFYSFELVTRDELQAAVDSAGAELAEAELLVSERQQHLRLGQEAAAQSQREVDRLRTGLRKAKRAKPKPDEDEIATLQSQIAAAEAELATHEQAVEDHKTKLKAAKGAAASRRLDHSRALARVRAVKPTRPYVLRVVRNEGDRSETFRGPTAQSVLDALDKPRAHRDRPQRPPKPTTEERIAQIEARLAQLEGGRARP